MKHIGPSTLGLVSASRSRPPNVTVANRPRAVLRQLAR